MDADEIADRLYGLELDEFTQARNDAAAELRAEGRREEADEIKALRKPTAAAAAVNRLVREQRKDVEQFLAAAAKLRDAQFAGKGDLAAATKAERDALSKLTRAAGQAVRQSLEAAAVDDDAAREVLAGRLVQELEPRGFGTLLAYGAPKSRAAPKKPAKPDDRAEQERLRAAKEELAAARAEERQARRRLEQAQKEVERTEGAVAAAERALAQKRGS